MMSCLQAFCPRCGIQLGQEDICPTHGAVRANDAKAAYCYWCGHAADATRTRRGGLCGAEDPRYGPCPCTGRNPAEERWEPPASSGSQS